MSLSNRSGSSPFSSFPSTSTSPSTNLSSPSGSSPADLANYPVLVTPNSLHFFPSPSGSWNVEVLTVYNPLPFPLQIKVLCTRAAAYAVDPSSCSIPPQSSMKMSVRMRSTLLEEQQRAESRTKTKDKFMIEQYDAKGNVQNKMVLSAHITTQANNLHSRGNSAAALASPSATFASSSGFSSASSAAMSASNAPSTSGGASRLWLLYVLTLPLRLFPLLLSILLIYCLNSGLIQLTDPQGTLWLSFFIGFITCVIQLKLLESAKAL